MEKLALLGGEKAVKKTLGEISYDIVPESAYPRVNELMKTGQISMAPIVREFEAKFREYTGKTYKEYLKELKLRYARRLLLVTEMSVTEISAASGYATQSHFNREFKNYYGLSPLGMRSGER